VAGPVGITLAVPPLPPTNLHVTTPATDNTPTWAWNASPSSDLAGYEISLDDSPPFNIGNTTGYTSLLVLSYGAHTLRVRAVDASGNRSLWTELSGVVIVLDEDRIKLNLNELFNRYMQAVEVYNSIDVLNCLNDGYWLLLQNPEGKERKFFLVGDKLFADWKIQVDWRKSPDNGGKGYKLDLYLGGSVFTNVTETTAMLFNQPFEIRERFSKQSEMILTSSGTITWSFVKVDGVWKINYMIITIKYINSETRDLDGFRFGLADDWLNF